MRKLLLSAAVAFFTLSATAQQFKVTKVEQLQVNGSLALYHPVFTPDGKSLMVSSEDYRGLGLVDLSTKNYRQLSTDINAGWKATMSPDCKTIITRSEDYATQRMSLFKIDVATAKKSLIVADIEHINDVKINSKTVRYAVAGKLRAVTDAKMTAINAADEQAFATCEDLKMVVYRNGVRTVVDPILATTGRDLNYCSISVSPNGKKLLFTCHNTSYVSNLDGSGLVSLGNVGLPVWRGNDWVVGIIEKNDSEVITLGEIVIIGADGKNYQQLSKSSEEIKLFPSVSPDGSKVAYHTLEGKVYMMTITQE